jgi:hypothetical protein
VRVDEAGHHHPAVNIDIDRILDPLDRLERRAVTGRDDRAITRRDEPVHHRTDIARRWSDPRTLVPERRQRQQSRAVKDEIGLRHPRSTIFQ